MFDISYFTPSRRQGFGSYRRVPSQDQKIWEAGPSQTRGVHCTQSYVFFYGLDSFYRKADSSIHLVHILSGDLILHKRTLEPIKTVVYGLRRYDLDRCAALVDQSVAANKDIKVVGFMSHKSKIYLVLALFLDFVSTVTDGPFVLRPMCSITWSTSSLVSKCLQVLRRTWSTIRSMCDSWYFLMFKCRWRFLDLQMTSYEMNEVMYVYHFCFLSRWFAEQRL